MGRCEQASEGLAMLLVTGSACLVAKVGVVLLKLCIIDALLFSFQSSHLCLGHWVVRVGSPAVPD